MFIACLGVLSLRAILNPKVVSIRWRKKLWAFGEYFCRLTDVTPSRLIEHGEIQEAVFQILKESQLS